MKSSLPKAVFTALLLLLCGQLFAQVLNGQVLDVETAKPISGAGIQILGTDQLVFSNEKGYFQIRANGMPTKLMIDAFGRLRQFIRVENPADSIRVSLALKPKYLVPLIVSASRRPEKITESLNSTSVLPARQIRLLPATADAAQLLKNIQSVNLVPNGVNKSTVNLRGRVGRHDTRTLVLKDYRVLNDFYNNIYENERTPVIPLDLQRVEIVRGPSGALWGPGVSAGIVHYLSKDAFAHPGLAVEIGYGSSFGDAARGQDANLFKVDLRYAGTNARNNLGWKIVAGARTGQDFIFDLSDNAEAPYGEGTQSNAAYAAGEVGGGPVTARDGQWTDLSNPGNNLNMEGTPGIDNAPWNLIPAFQSFNLEGTLEYRPNDDFSLALVPSFGFSEGNFGDEGLFYRENAAQFNTQLRATIGKFFASANYRTTPGFSGDLNDRGWQAQYNDTRWRDPGSSRYLDFQAQLPIINLLENTDLIAGVDAKTMKREFVDTWPDGTSNDLRQLGVFSDERYSIVGGYAQVTHRLTDRLRLVAAGRLDNFFVYDMAFSPKLGLVYNPDELTGVRLSYNVTNTVPTFARTFAQSPIGRRRVGRAGNLFRNLYGTGQPITFNNVRSGLILGNNLSSLYDGIDAPLQLILDDLIENSDDALLQSLRGLQVAGVTTGNLFSLENPASPVRINTANQLNNPKAGFETTTSVEIGYQIYVEDKLSVNVDLHYNTEKNVPTAAIAISPGVALPVVGGQLERALLDAGVNPDLAKQIGNLAQDNYGNDIAAIVQSDQHQELGLTNGINYGYRGYGKINYFGLDLGAEYKLNERLTFFFNASLLSNTEFSSKDIDEDPELNRRYFLNVPGTQLRPGLFFHPKEEGGFFGSLAVQYRSGFTANFGDFTGELPATTTIDASLGYQLGNGISLTVSGTNLSGADYRGLPYLPVQGRMVIGSVRYELAGKRR